MRVEVGYVELLHSSPAAGDERGRLIAEASERRRTPPARREAAAPPDCSALLKAQDRDTVQAMRTAKEHSEVPVSDREPATITLLGRTSAWQQRLPAGAAERGSRPPQPARGERLLLASWLHHPGYGTLGVYLAAEADTHSQALRRGQWVQLTLAASDTGSHRLLHHDMIDVRGDVQSSA